MSGPSLHRPVHPLVTHVTRPRGRPSGFACDRSVPTSPHFPLRGRVKSVKSEKDRSDERVAGRVERGCSEEVRRQHHEPATLRSTIHSIFRTLLPSMSPVCLLVCPALTPLHFRSYRAPYGRDERSHKSRILRARKRPTFLTITFF